jgi:hypothetical protein
LLSRSAKLEAVLAEYLELKPYDGSTRLMVSRVLCGVAFEHAESAKILIASGNFTSAIGLLRLQYEALVRATWLLYAATDAAVAKLAAELTHEGAKKAEKMPMLADRIQGVRVLEHYGTTTLGMRSIVQLHFRNDEIRLMGGVQVL